MGNDHVKASDLTSSDPKQQERALRHVYKLSKDEIYRDRVIANSAIPALLNFTHHTDSANFSRIIQTLFYLSERKAAADAIVGNEGGADALALLCQCPVEDTLLRLGDVIQNCITHVSPTRCAEKGFVRPLAHLMKKSAFARVQCLAVQILAQLSSFPAAQNEMEATGCIYPLVSALSCKCCVRNAAKVLANLALRGPETRKAIIQSRGLEGLSATMFRTRDGDADDAQLIQSATAVCYLAGEPTEVATRASVRTKVTVFPFLSLVVSSKNPKVLNAAARGLSIILSSEKEVLDMVHMHGVGVSVFVSLLDADENQWLQYSIDRLAMLADTRFRCNICKAVITTLRWHCHQCECYDLCERCHGLTTQDRASSTIYLNGGGDVQQHQQQHCSAHEMTLLVSDFRRAIIEAGVLPRLAQLVLSLYPPIGDPHEACLVDSALKVLAMLSEEKIAKFGMMNNSILAMLAHVLNYEARTSPRHRDQNAHVRCATILANISEIESHRPVLVERNFLGLVLPFLQTSSVELQVMTVKVVANLGPVAMPPDATPALIIHDGLGILMNMAYCADVRVRPEIIRCVYALSVNESVCPRLAVAGVVERLYYFMNGSEPLGSEAYGQCIATVRHLLPYTLGASMNSTDWFSLLSSATNRILPNWILNDLTRVMAALFAEVSMAPDCREVLSSIPTACQWLERCGESQDTEVWENTTKALKNLSSQDGFLDQLQPFHCAMFLTVLTRYSTPHTDPIILSHTSATLANLSARQPLKMLFQQATLEAVVDLAGSLDLTVQQNAVRCLKNLCCNGPLSVCNRSDELVHSSKAPLTLKCHRGEGSVLLSVPHDMSFSTLAEALNQEYKVPVMITYDYHGDRVPISSQLSLETAIQHHETDCEQKCLPVHLRVFELFLQDLDIPTNSARTNQKSATDDHHHHHQKQPPENGGPNLTPTKLGATPGRCIRWRRGEFLGKWGFATVFKALDLTNGQPIAVKKITTELTLTQQRYNAVIKSFQREIELLQPLSHENIVQYLGSQRDITTLYIFLEFVPGGSISSQLNEVGRFTEDIIKKYIRQILDGLAYLHAMNIIHGDIKGANILVTDEGVIKLADFGASRKLISLAENQSVGGRTMFGTPAFMSPEAIQLSRISEKSDIWSVGATTLEMYTGHAPYVELTQPFAIMYHVVNFGPPRPFPPFVGRDGCDFLNCCFNFQPALRPSATQLLDHPFLNSGVSFDSVSGEQRRSAVCGTTDHTVADGGPHHAKIPLAAQLQPHVVRTNASLRPSSTTGALGFKSCRHPCCFAQPQTEPLLTRKQSPMMDPRVMAAADLRVTEEAEENNDIPPEDANGDGEGEYLHNQDTIGQSFSDTSPNVFCPLCDELIGAHWLRQHVVECHQDKPEWVEAFTLYVAPPEAHAITNEHHNASASASSSSSCSCLDDTTSGQDESDILTPSRSLSSSVVMV